MPSNSVSSSFQIASVPSAGTRSVEFEFSGSKTKGACRDDFNALVNEGRNLKNQQTIARSHTNRVQNNSANVVSQAERDGRGRQASVTQRQRVTSALQVENNIDKNIKNWGQRYDQFLKWCTGDKNTDNVTEDELKQLKDVAKSLGIYRGGLKGYHDQLPPLDGRPGVAPRPGFRPVLVR